MQEYDRVSLNATPQSMSSTRADRTRRPSDGNDEEEMFAADEKKRQIFLQVVLRC